MNTEENLSIVMDNLEFYRRRYKLLGDTITQLVFWVNDAVADPDARDHWHSVVDELHRVAEMWRVESIDTLEEIERRLLPIKEELGL